MLKLLTAPHHIVEMGHVTYDVCKLSFLITKGIIRKLIQVKECLIALQAKTPHNDSDTNVPVAKKLE